MLSKFLRPCLAESLRVARPRSPEWQPRRCMAGMLPPNQYDVPFPKRLQLTYAMVKYWEIIPLVVTTAFSCTLCILAIFWALAHKMDVVFSTHNYNTIERTMDLRKPSIHKAVVINQRYEPWPEVQIALDKMVAAEKRALSRLQASNQI